MRSKSILIYYKSNNLNYSRLGISASKKFGNAVKRNFFKRIVREEFRKNSIKENLSFDILVVTNNRFLKTKDKITNSDLITIRKNLETLFAKIPS